MNRFDNKHAANGILKKISPGCLFFNFDWLAHYILSCIQSKSLLLPAEARRA